MFWAQIVHSEPPKLISDPENTVWTRGGAQMEICKLFFAIFIFVFIIVIVFFYPEKAFTVLQPPRGLKSNF